MDALLKRLSRAGLRRGLTGEHWAWLVLAGAAYLLRRARRPEEAVTTLAVAPGERYLVRLLPPASGRRGRAEREWTEVVEPEGAGFGVGTAAGPPTGA